MTAARKGLVGFDSQDHLRHRIELMDYQRIAQTAEPNEPGLLSPEPGQLFRDRSLKPADVSRQQHEFLRRSSPCGQRIFVPVIQPALHIVFFLFCVTENLIDKRLEQGEKEPGPSC